jgi:plastocyanin
MINLAEVLLVTNKMSHKEAHYLLILGSWLCVMSFSSCDTAFSSVTITAEEFRFTPNFVRLPPRQIIRLIVRNQGREPHVFQSPILTLRDVRFGGGSWEGQVKGRDGIVIQPGKRIELSVELSEGLYPFRCRIKGHKGMEGTLVVQQ